MDLKKAMGIVDVTDKPGSRVNLYVIEEDCIGRIEIRARHLTGDERDFGPGGRFNPYIIEKSDVIGEKEMLVPRYYTSRW